MPAGAMNQFQGIGVASRSTERLLRIPHRAAGNAGLDLLLDVARGHCLFSLYALVQDRGESISDGRVEKAYLITVDKRCMIVPNWINNLYTLLEPVK